MRCAEPLQGKAASSFFSVTYFRLEIKYKRKFVAMTHEEQISLFEALALNGAWLGRVLRDTAVGDLIRKFM